MTEEHVKNLYRAFQTQGRKGVCNTCHCVRTCIAHVADLTNECFNCCIKRLMREEQERERQNKQIPLNLKEFTEL